MAILKVFGSIALSVILGLAKDEFRAWIPTLTRRFVASAVARLPQELRSRFWEEWQADLEETPGEFTRLCRSVGFFGAAFRLSRISGGRSRWVGEVWTSRCIAALTLAAFAPLLLVCMAIVRTRSYGPIFLRIPYRDWDGRRFSWWRFRSFVMLRVDGEEFVANDRLLRRISVLFGGLLLLISVAKGEMALSTVLRHIFADQELGVPDLPKEKLLAPTQAGAQA